MNDDTSWGALIHIAARHPEWRVSLLAGLVDSSRVVHESFASFMSLSLARARHADAERVLDAYPVYRPLAERMARLTASVPTGHRRDLAATGIARWCMSSPVLDLLLDGYPSPPSLAQIPSAMRPSHRFRAVQQFANDSAVGAAALAADEAFTAAHGGPIDSMELSDADAALDAAWAQWEDSFVRALVSADPILSAMPTSAPNEHLNAAAALIEALARDGVLVEAPHQADEGSLSDAESTSRLTAAVSLVLRDPYQAAVAAVGAGVDVDELLGLCEASPAPFVVVHGRRPDSLARSFDFGESCEEFAADCPDAPVFAVRLLVDDRGRDLILHARVQDPPMYSRLFAAWDRRGGAANCISASCFLGVDWQDLWMPALRPVPTVVLVDTGLAGMVGHGRLLGATGRVWGAYVGLSHAYLTGLVWHVDGHPHVMLAIGDDLTVQLLAGQLADLLGDRLSMSDADWSEWFDVLSAVASSVIGTESRLVFDGGVSR